MTKFWIGTAMAAGVLAAASAASAEPQSGPRLILAQADNPQAAPTTNPAHHVRPRQPRRPTSEVQPDLDPKDQLAPSQIKQSMPAAVPMPGKPARRAAAHAAGGGQPRGRAHSIACKGAFAKDSSHLKIAVAFDSKNITFTEVDSSVGKVQATVIYPDDPKRRLEVWWNNPASRSDTNIIVINGQSTWLAPKGVRLGLSLVALEKLNRKPFKLKGFGKDNIAAVSDWQGGALAVLPGGCKIGVNLAIDPKASADVRSAVAGDKEFGSADPAMRAAKPTIGEIIIGY
jgi:hypothetical protein